MPKPDDLVNGTIGTPYRAPGMQAVGATADLVNALAEQLEKARVTMPSWSPIAANKSLTLRDLTIGDLGRVLEDISYGMGPMRGGNYATGGIGTYGVKPEAMDLLNIAPAVGLAGKAATKGAKALAPTAAEMLRQKSEAFMRSQGLLKDITVYHGSPHKFDKFDSSKIGTGEGAQAYGHGLYLAESPEVAQQYAKNVKDMMTIQTINSELSRLAKIMHADEITYRNYRSDLGRKAAEQYDALMAKRDGVRQAPGSLYTVDLPDPMVSRMLDWDKPLSQQPLSVQKGTQQVFDDRFQQLVRKGSVPSLADAAGADFYEAFRRGGDSHSAALLADDLVRYGIPGIRYLDGASRGASKGTSNFVVFPGEEDKLKILRRE